MILEEINIGESEGSKRKAIEDNAGQQVILNDGHQMWCHGQILETDGQCYKLKIGDGRGERQLHYHDLEKLIIIRNHPNYPRPKF